MRKIGEITVHEVGQPTYEGERNHGQRRPFFYLPKSQVLLLGAPGGDHWNMVSRDPVGKRFQSEAFDDDETAHGGLYRTPSGQNVVEFYRGTPDSAHIPAVVKALGADQAQLNEWHVGDEVHDNPDRTWHWDFQSGVAKNDDKWQLKAATPGRALATLPWQWGEWGKGIYYPETGVLQTWGDDRTHMDVWGDDENYSQPGSAHHIVIRPNGTVHDQGSFARDFSDAEPDIEGLQQALKELDPRLRLDTSSEWSFGPTEPMEEEPSSVSRGEEGGQIHDVQTANDFAGSL